MRLKSINYIEYENEPREWKIEGIELENVNLIVGINASGKSRLLNVISSLGELLSRKVTDFTPTLRYNAVFSNKNGKKGGKEIVYELSIRNNVVTKERLLKGEELLLERSGTGKGRIRAEQMEFLKFKTNGNEIAAFIKRDSYQHPFLDDLYKWGSNQRYYRFGASMGWNVVSSRPFNGERKPLEDNELKYGQNVVDIYIEGIKKREKHFQDSIIDDMNSIGYSIEEIGITSTEFAFPGHLGVVNELYVKEKELSDIVRQTLLSQGMFRALSLLIQLNYALMIKLPLCVLIDDIGEGLDFYRARSLINLLIKKVENTPVQLIMTTNDRFVMNSVPLKYWSIIERSGGKCKVYNYKNSRNIFDEFDFTGLSNFDFFTTKSFLQSDHK